MTDYTFRLPEQAYTPSTTVSSNYASVRELSREYVRLRGIAQKRIGRLKGENLATFGANFPTLTQLKDNPMTFRGLLSEQLASVRSFILNEYTLLPKARARAQKVKIEGLHAAGFDFVNTDNLAAFGRWMEEARALYGKRYRFSDEIAQAFETVERIGIDPDKARKDFELFVENEEELEQLAKEWKTSDKAVSKYDYIIKELGG